MSLNVAAKVKETAQFLSTVTVMPFCELMVCRLRPKQHKQLPEQERHTCSCSTALVGILACRRMQCKLTSKEIKLGVLLLQPTNRRHPYIVCKCRHIHGSCTEKTSRVPCFFQKSLFVHTLSRKGVFIPYYLEAFSLRHICCTKQASKLCQRSCPK